MSKTDSMIQLTEDKLKKLQLFSQDYMTKLTDEEIQQILKNQEIIIKAMDTLSYWQTRSGTETADNYIIPVLKIILGEKK